MPTKKHKRKASAHSKPKMKKSSGLIASNPKAFVLFGLFLMVISMFFLAFGVHNDALFGLGMLSLIVGAVLTLFAKFAMMKKNKKIGGA